MTERLRIMVPGPPVAWARAGGNGARRFTKPAVRVYSSWVRECAMVAVDGYAADWPVSEDTRYDVRIYLCRSSLIRTDLDNAAKLVGDSLNGVIWPDDSQHADMRVVRAKPDRSSACMVIDVLPWTGELPTIEELLSR